MSEGACQSHNVQCEPERFETVEPDVRVLARSTLEDPLIVQVDGSGVNEDAATSATNENAKTSVGATSSNITAVKPVSKFYSPCLGIRINSHLSQTVWRYLKSDFRF